MSEQQQNQATSESHAQKDNSVVARICAKLALIQHLCIDTKTLCLDEGATYGLYLFLEQLQKDLKVLIQSKKE